MAEWILQFIDSQRPSCYVKGLTRISLALAAWHRSVDNSGSQFNLSFNQKTLSKGCCFFRWDSELKTTQPNQRCAWCGNVCAQWKSRWIVDGYSCHWDSCSQCYWCNSPLAVTGRCDYELIVSQSLKGWMGQKQRVDNNDINKYQQQNVLKFYAPRAFLNRLKYE